MQWGMQPANLSIFPLFHTCIKNTCSPKGQEIICTVTNWVTFSSQKQKKTKKNITVSWWNCTLTTLLSFIICASCISAWVALPFAVHLALCPLCVCPLPWQPPLGESTSFHCQQEQDGDKDGETSRDGRWRGKWKKREREKVGGKKGNCRGSERFWEKRADWRGAAKKSVKSTVKWLRDKTRETERWREDVKTCRLQIKRKWDNEREVQIVWRKAAGGVGKKEQNKTEIL